MSCRLEFNFENTQTQKLSVHNDKMCKTTGSTMQPVARPFEKLVLSAFDPHTCPNTKTRTLNIYFHHTPRQRGVTQNTVQIVKLITFIPLREAGLTLSLPKYAVS